MNMINTQVINNTTIWTNCGKAAEGLMVIINDEAFNQAHNHMPLAFVRDKSKVITVNTALTKADKHIIDAILSHEVGHVRQDAFYIMEDNCLAHVFACECAADRYAHDQGYDILSVLKLILSYNIDVNDRIENLLAYINGDYITVTPFGIMTENGKTEWTRHVEKLSDKNLIKAHKVLLKLKDMENLLNYDVDTRLQTIAVSSTALGVLTGVVGRNNIKFSSLELFLGGILGYGLIFGGVKLTAKRGYIITLTLAVERELKNREL